MAVYPVVEEIVFRGWLLDWWGRAFGRRQVWILTLANLATSVLFAATHLLTRDSITAVGVFVPSLVLGLLYERTRSLAWCIVVHALWNAAFFAGACV